jgi:alcohol dehydrogenase class IV
VLGGRFDVAHGVSNSVILPYVPAFNADAILAAAPGVADRLGGRQGALPVEDDPSRSRNFGMGWYCSSG